MYINDYPVKIIGDYVFSPCENQFEGGSKVSYWVSKKGYTFASYAFSVNNPHAAESMLADEYLNGYISLFESLSKSNEVVNIYTSTYNESVDDMALFLAKDIINRYIKYSYDDDSFADFSNLKRVEIAGGYTEDEVLSIVTFINLIDYCVFTEVNDKVVQTEQYASLLDMIQYSLKALNYDDLVHVDIEKLIPIYREFLVGKSVVYKGKTWTISKVTQDEKVLLEDYTSTTQLCQLKKIACLYHKQEMGWMISDSSAEIKFKSVNVDGDVRTWVFNNVSHLEEVWLSEDCDLPALDDEVFDVHVGSKKLSMTTFEDLLKYLSLIADIEEG